MIRVLILSVTLLRLCCRDFGKKAGIPIPPSLVDSDNRSRSSFPQRLLSVKHDISLLLIELSNITNSY